jgi:invasion protein IalB
MANTTNGCGRNVGTGVLRATTLLAVAGAFMTAVAGGAAAQQKTAPQKAAPPAKAAEPAPASAAGTPPKGAWVKLCEQATIEKPPGKDGKPVTETKNLCLTHHERLDGTTGMVMVSAAVREVEGVDKKHLMIMVPLGMAIQPGLSTAVYTKEMWAKVAKGEKVDPKALKPIELKYSLCHPGGCTAEIEATKEILDQMRAGGGMEVLVITAAGKGAGFAVPLDGFAAALSGPPVDNREYTRDRAQVMLQIRQRQAELMQKYKEEQEKQGAAGAAPAPAAAPAKK